MKIRLLLTILFAYSCLSATAQNTGDAPVQAMVKHQPFPHATGVAVDSPTYILLKSKIRAADTLRKTSESRIASLTGEIKANQSAVEHLTRLSQHDAARAAELSGAVASLQDALADAQADRNTAQNALDDIRDSLPRRLRRTLRKSHDPEQLAVLAAEYIDRLRIRKWQWAGAAGATGVLLTLAALL